jgi:hypothetical protein
MKRFIPQEITLIVLVLVAAFGIKQIQAQGQSMASVYQDIGSSGDFDPTSAVVFDFEASFGNTSWPRYWYSNQAWMNTDFTWHERSDELRWCTQPEDPENWITARTIAYRHHGRFRVDATPFVGAVDLFLTIRYKDNLRPGQYEGAPVYVWNGSWVRLGFLGGENDHRWKTEQFTVGASQRVVVDGRFVFKIGDDGYTDSLIGELPIDKIKLSGSSETPEFEPDTQGLWPQLGLSQFDDLGQDFEYTPGEGPFFPFGILTNVFISDGGSASQPGYGQKDTWQALEDHHMNVYAFHGWEQEWYSRWTEWPGETTWDDPGMMVELGLDEHLIQAAGHGLKVFPNLYTDTQMWSIQRTYGNAEAALDYLEGMMRDHASNPALGAWYIIDEWDHEDLGYAKPHEFTAQLAARARAADPLSPILILSMGFMGPSTWEMTSESSDFVVVDVYPARDFFRELLLQGERLDEMRGILGDDAAYILMALGQNYDEGQIQPIDGEARPYRPQELLAQAYMGLAHGSKGVLFWMGNFGHPDFEGPNWPAAYSQQIWQGFDQVGEELFGEEGLVDALLPPGGLVEIMGERGLVNASNASIHYALYRTGEGARILVALNASNTFQSVTFTIPGLEAGIVHTRFETGRNLTAGVGTFQDIFQPLERHVYVLPSLGSCSSDINGDLYTDVLDLQLLVNLIQEGNPGSYCADLNGDGLVNNADLQTLIQDILGR